MNWFKSKTLGEKMRERSSKNLVSGIVDNTYKYFDIIIKMLEKEEEKIKSRADDGFTNCFIGTIKLDEIPGYTSEFLATVDLVYPGSNRMAEGEIFTKDPNDLYSLNKTLKKLNKTIGKKETIK